MEDIRRNIKLFFATYGGLLFQIIGIIAIFLFALHSINYLYKENNAKASKENIVSEQEIKEEEKNIEKEKEDKQYISEFLDYCNAGKTEEAYSMLSEKCIKEKYQTIDIFKKEYLDKIFIYKKDYEIEKENDMYKVKILEGILESGSIENRNNIISYYKIEESVLKKYIYIER